MPVNNFSLNAPTDYTAELADIARRRQLAQTMQAQSMQPIERFSSGGIEAPMSWTQGLAKLMQAYSGGKSMEAATAGEKKIGEQYRSDLADTLSKALQAGRGMPASSENIMDEQANGGLGAPATINAPAVAPDSARMAAILMQHPATQGIGLQQMTQNFNNQDLARIMNQYSAGAGGATPPAGAGTPPAGGASGQGAGSSPQSAGGVPEGVNPLAWAIAVQSGDKNAVAKLVQQGYENVNKLTRFSAGGGLANQSGKVVVSAPDASGRFTTYGPNGPTVGLAPGAADTTTAQSNIPKPGAPMVEIPVSNQRKLQLTQPQFLTYVNSGGKILPAKYQSLANELPGVQFSDGPMQGMPQQAQPAPPIDPTAGRPPAEQDAIRQVMAAGNNPMSVNVPTQNSPSQGGIGTIPTNALIKPGMPDTGVVGATQSQGEQIQQAGQTETVKQINQGQAKIFNDHYDASAKGVQTLPMISAARQALDSGAVTGFGANFFLDMNRALSAAGFRASQDATKNTQVFASTTARQVLQIIKNLGSGSGISDEDRKYAAKIIGGDIVLDASSIRRLLTISETAIHNDAKWVNDRVPTYQKLGADIQPLNVEQFAGTMNEPSPGGKDGINPQAIVDEMRRRGLAK